MPLTEVELGEIVAQLLAVQTRLDDLEVGVFEEGEENIDDFGGGGQESLCFLVRGGNNSEVTVNAGWFIVLGEATNRWPDATSDSDTVSVTGDGYIYVRALKLLGSWVEVKFKSTQPNAASSTYYEIPLCKVTKTGSIVRIDGPQHASNIVVGAAT